MKNRYFFIVIVLILILIPIRSSVSQTVPDETENGQNSGLLNDILNDVSGGLTLRYRGRSAEGERGSDQDFRETLRLNYGQLQSDKISAYMHGSLRQDIDDPGALFSSIDDTHDSSVRGYLYEFYGNVTDIGFVENAKIGRQYLNEVENIHFDGAHLSMKPVKNARFSAYGGMPVYFHESDSDGDWLAGIAAEFNPFKDTAGRLDYIVSNDDSDEIGDHHDNLFIASAWQNIRPWWRVFGRYSAIDSVSRDVQLRSMWNFQSINLDVMFSYYKQPQTLDGFTVEFNEFNPIIGGYQPYDQYLLDIYKGIGQHMGVNFGATIRELKDESDEGSFNHDYERYYFTWSVFDFPIKGLSASITGEDFASAGDDVQSLSFDVSKDFNKKLKISLGTYYSLFKFDSTVAPELFNANSITGNQFLLDKELAESERDNVRSYYIRVKTKLFDRWELSGRYELENYDSDIFHTVQTALKLKF